MKHLLFFILLFFINGCFDLKEEVYIRADGSGKFQMVLDFSANRAMLHELMYASDGAPYPTFGEHEKQLGELVQVWKDGAAALNGLNGISNAHEIFDRDSLLLGVQFDFADVQALNLALALREDNGGNFPGYSFEKGRLTKNNVFSFYKLIEKLQPSSQNLPEENAEMQKKTIFAQIRYACTIEVAGKVKKYSNKAFSPQGKNKLLLLPVSLTAIQNGKANVGNEVRFK